MKGSSPLGLMGLLSLSLVCVFVAISEEALSDDSYTILNSPLITENTTLSNGTWAVFGSIMVINGTLTLDNATIVFNLSDHSNLGVALNGYLVCRNSSIHGPALTSVSFTSNASFSDCRLGNVNDKTDVLINTNKVRMVKSTVVHWKILVRGILVAMNCTFDDGLASITGGHGIGPASGPYDILLEDCEFKGVSRGDFAVRLSGAGYQNITCNATITNCTFGPSGSGISVQYFKKCGWVLISGCEFNVTDMGIALFEVNRCVDVGHNIISGHSGVVSMSSSSPYPSIHNLTIHARYNGLSVMGCINQSFRSLNITSGMFGVTTSTAGINLFNCTLEASEYDIRLTGDDRVTLYDCVHGTKVHRSNNGDIYAFRTVTVRTVRWEDGPNITWGTTYLRSGAGMSMALLDNDELKPVLLTYWHINISINDLYDNMLAIHNTDGEDFYSDHYVISNASALDIEIKDHLRPSFIAMDLQPGSYHNTVPLEVSGECTDKGSGVCSVQVRCDRGTWTEATIDPGGRFSAMVEIPAEGSHSFDLTVRDHSGNTNDGWITGVTVDLTPPIISVVQLERWTNRKYVQLVIETDWGSKASINDNPVTVSYVGVIDELLHLQEGVNYFKVTVVDLAGNVNETVLSVELDIVPPLVIINHPQEGGWVNTSNLRLEGVTEVDATVIVGKAEAERDGEAFWRDFTVEEGPIMIVVKVVDRAGNEAVHNVTFTVDLTPPRLTIEEPPDLEVMMSLSPFPLSGRVEDVHDVIVTVNGLEADVGEGTWSFSFHPEVGFQVLIVKAEDIAGNQIFAQPLHVHYDPKPPMMTVRLLVGPKVYHDHDGTIMTSQANATLKIEIDEPCQVEVEGYGLWELTQGVTSIVLDLTENALNVIAINAYDRVGNPAEGVVFSVHVDTLPPVLEVLEPSNGGTTNVPELTIVGLTDPGAYVTVQSRAIHVDENGTFSAEMVLSKGVNRIEVVSVDDMGNRANLTVIVFLQIPEEPGNIDGEWPPSWRLISVVIFVLGIVSIAALAYRGRLH